MWQGKTCNVLSVMALDTGNIETNCFLLSPLKPTYCLYCKTYLDGTFWNCINKAITVRTHKICACLILSYNICNQVSVFNIIAPDKIIMRACLYNVDSLKPHFYIVKLGFMGYTLCFLFLLKNMQKYEKYQNFYLKIFIFSW